MYLGIELQQQGSANQARTDQSKCYSHSAVNIMVIICKCAT